MVGMLYRGCSVTSFSGIPVSCVSILQKWDLSSDKSNLSCFCVSCTNAIQLKHLSQMEDPKGAPTRTNSASLKRNMSFIWFAVFAIQKSS